MPDVQNLIGPNTWTNSPEHEIRTEKCSDTCHHKMKFVLTFTKNDLTLLEIKLNFGSDTCQIKVKIVQVNTKVLGKCHLSDCYFMLCSQAFVNINFELRNVYM